MFAGRKMAPEAPMNKSKFAKTCNRLSQFLKERRSLGDFASVQNMSSSMLDINGTKENMTMNLFPKKMEEEMDVSKASLTLFPLTTPSSADESSENKADLRDSPIPKEEPKTTTSKMTIFYGGQVIVFDDLPEDKAQEIMSLATKLGTVGSNSEPQVQAFANPNLLTQPTQGGVLEQTASLSDLPIARRVSLHRFMEKRKDRIAAASPYQVQINMNQPHLMMHLRQKQQPQQELELKLF